MAAVSPWAARIRRQILTPGRDQPQSGDRLARWTNAVDRRQFAGHGAANQAATTRDDLELWQGPLSSMCT